MYTQLSLQRHAWTFLPNNDPMERELFGQNGPILLGRLLLWGYGSTEKAFSSAAHSLSPPIRSPQHASCKSTTQACLKLWPVS